jgi:hypothetical protein
MGIKASAERRMQQTIKYQTERIAELEARLSKSETAHSDTIVKLQESEAKVARALELIDIGASVRDAMPNTRQLGAMKGQNDGRERHRTGV